MEKSAKEYFESLALINELKRQEQTLKIDMDKAKADFRLKRDAFKNFEYDIITK